MRSEHSTSTTKLRTIEQIAEYVGVSERTVRRWIKKKLLAAHHFDGLLRISEPDFRLFKMSREWCDMS